MSKPFPCCCQCVHCPESGGDWQFLFCDMQVGGVTFSTSHNGDALHTYLNSLGVFIRNMGTLISATGANPRLYTQSPTSSGLLFVTISSPGEFWRYSVPGLGGGLWEITNVRLRVTIRDDCGKVRPAAGVSGQQDPQLVGDVFNISGGFFIGSRALSNFSFAAPTSPNCNATHLSTSVSGVWPIGNFSPSGNPVTPGVLVMKPDNGISVTCPI